MAYARCVSVCYSHAIRSQIQLCGEVVRVSFIYKFCGTSVVHSLMITTSLSPQPKASISKGQDSICNQLALSFKGLSLATQ